ncbi:MAG TPA: alkaline phosphatase family protein [Methylomirabilota bacterium]|jgi:phosphonoacetate hydrolase|nr:alkaline phosphatase family protein [Methylomirabilota bacterium]
MKQPRRALVFLVDGFDPAYVQPTRMPRLARLMKAGASTLDGRGVLPSLTNVNHISLLTGTYPERHGLSTNFYFDRASWREVFMDQVEFVREPLLFERLQAAGWSTGLVTAKEKLTRLLRRGLDHCVDMKSHPDGVRTVVGMPPDIFSLEINVWVLRAAREVATRLRPDFLYVATTDYPQHKLGPDEPAMQAYLEESDEALGRLLDAYDLDDTVVVFTADHGMNAKPRSVSPIRALAEAGIRAHGLPLIRDGLFAHHRDLGGALYLYFRDAGAVADARAVLARTSGVDEVVSREEAGRDHLPADRVGDLICWAARDVALGIWDDGPVSRPESGLRSHGSKHEQRIPMVIAGPGVRAGAAIREGRTVDLMPTLCHLVGVEAGPVQGRVLDEVLA